MKIETLTGGCMKGQITIEQGKQEIEKQYKQIQKDADDLDRWFKEILQAPKYKDLWPDIKQWMDWVDIARNMADKARTTGEVEPNKDAIQKFLGISNQIKNTLELEPGTHDKINGKVSGIETMINEILITFSLIEWQEISNMEDKEPE